MGTGCPGGKRPERGVDPAPSSSRGYNKSRAMSLPRLWVNFTFTLGTSNFQCRGINTCQINVLCLFQPTNCQPASHR
jgi:hypothetical protein